MTEFKELVELWNERYEQFNNDTEQLQRQREKIGAGKRFMPSLSEFDKLLHFIAIQILQRKHENREFLLEKEQLQDLSKVFIRNNKVHIRHYKHRNLLTVHFVSEYGHNHAFTNLAPVLGENFVNVCEYIKRKLTSTTPAYREASVISLHREMLENLAKQCDYKIHFPDTNKRWCQINIPINVVAFVSEDKWSSGPPFKEVKCKELALNIEHQSRYDGDSLRLKTSVIITDGRGMETNKIVTLNTDMKKVINQAYDFVELFVQELSKEKVKTEQKILDKIKAEGFLEYLTAYNLFGDESEN